MIAIVNVLNCPELNESCLNVYCITFVLLVFSEKNSNEKNDDSSLKGDDFVLGIILLICIEYTI